MIMRRDRQMVVQFPRELEEDLRVNLILHGCRIADCRDFDKSMENTKFENPMYNKGYDDGFSDAMNEKEKKGE